MKKGDKVILLSEEYYLAPYGCIGTFTGIHGTLTKRPMFTFYNGGYVVDAFIRYGHFMTLRQFFKEDA
jgi:hypothetical protein